MSKQGFSENAQISRELLLKVKDPTYAKLIYPCFISLNLKFLEKIITIAGFGFSEFIFL